MAKGKHSAALFEVIGKSKGMRPEPQKGSLSTPRWWFKGGKGQDQAAVVPVVATPATARAPSSVPLAAPVPVVVERAPAAPSIAAPSNETKPERAARALGPMSALPRMAAVTAVTEDDVETRPAPSKVHVQAGAAPSSAAEEGPKKVHVDPDRQEIRMRLSYTSAIVVVFALAVTVALAVVIGNRLGGGWGTADLNASTAELLNGPANPAVLNAKPGQGRSAPVYNDPVGLGATETRSPLSEIPRTPQTADGRTAQPASAKSPGVNPTPPTTAGRVPRVVGINYFIVQSYPEEADARAVVELLAQAGVPTTIERGLVGYPKWNIVVTSQGFTSLRAPEAETLRKRIDQMSADQGRADKKWKTLTPQGYRWR